MDATLPAFLRLLADGDVEQMYAWVMSAYRMGAIQVLKKIRQRFCMPDCTCEREILHCACETELPAHFIRDEKTGRVNGVRRAYPCGCPVRFRACVHTPRVLVPEKVESAVLWLTLPKEYADRNQPRENIIVDLAVGDVHDREKVIRCMAMRRSLNRALRRPDDSWVNVKLLEERRQRFGQIFTF